MSERQKILQITSYPPPRSGWGVRVQFLKRQLEADGHECVVLNIGNSRKVPSLEYETVLGPWDFVAKVWRYCRRGFTVHAHLNAASGKGLALVLVAELIGLLAGSRCVLTFHAGTEQKYFPKVKAGWLRPLFWLSFAIPSRIICNSEAVKAKIQEYGVQADRISPIPAFSRQYLEFERTRLPEALERFFASFSSVVFCYLNLRPLFYPLELVEGFARLASCRRDVGLVLCGLSGYPEPELARALPARISERRLDDRVCLVQDLDHDQFLTALSRARVYVRTHASDGVCSSVLEALALGIPVVASQNGHRPSGVLTYRADDPEDLASAVEMAMSPAASTVKPRPHPEIPDTLSTEVDVLVGA